MYLKTIKKIAIKLISLNITIETNVHDYLQFFFCCIKDYNKNCKHNKYVPVSIYVENVVCSGLRIEIV